MVMFPEDIMLTSANKEKVYEMRADYPYCLRNVVTREGNTQVATWHWHEEFEFVYIQEGQVEYWIGGKCILLSEQDGIFINRNVMHQVTAPKSGVQAKYQVFMFRKQFLAEEGSLLEKQYIRPLLDKKEFQAVVFRKENGSQEKVLERLREISRIQEEKSFGFEMKIRNQVAEMWIYFLRLLNIASEEIMIKATGKEERLKSMLEFIQQNYMEDISLKNIVDAAQVSEREGLRCFQEEIHTTPFTYLKEYRIQMACMRLQNTQDTITVIAGMCGFQSSSYFGKVFRKCMGCTPYEYRMKKVHDKKSNSIKNFVQS